MLALKGRPSRVKDSRRATIHEVGLNEGRWSLACESGSYDYDAIMPSDTPSLSVEKRSSSREKGSIREISSASPVSHREYLTDVIRFLDVLRVMAGRDILVRYRYALFGVLWAVLRPLLVLVTFSAVYKGLVAREGSASAYSWLVLCAAPVWIFFSATLQDSINFVLRDAGLINRVYFPRILLVFSGVSVGVVDFFISLSLVLIAFLCLGTIHLSQVALLPLVVLWAIVFVSGCALWISTLNARFRDVSNLVPFCMHLLFILSPVGYSAHYLPAEYAVFLAINPLVGILESFRFCLLGQPVMGGEITIAVGVSVTAAVVVTGYLVFRRFEAWINDYA